MLIKNEACLTVTMMGVTRSWEFEGIYASPVQIQESLENLFFARERVLATSIETIGQGSAHAVKAEGEALQVRFDE